MSLWVSGTWVIDVYRSGRSRDEVNNSWSSPALIHSTLINETHCEGARYPWAQTQCICAWKNTDCLCMGERPRSCERCGGEQQSMCTPLSLQNGNLCAPCSFVPHAILLFCRDKMLAYLRKKQFSRKCFARKICSEDRYWPKHREWNHDLELGDILVLKPCSGDLSISKL